ncbi:MAG: hypothetical protein KF760_14090 [Candidatus Eremiobacteraeota bacterium]|nr:hypothetical protein [Candidatus Eremiobacteraeota bacterium]MCW5868955.1 hypothetical protein [Candidatus Eremiobacteraeota bacterium]
MFEFVSAKVRDAALKASGQLSHLGVRHALVGGLAVGAHGYLRATKDVHFLVGEEAFEHHGLLVTFKPGIPIEVDGIRIDYLSPSAFGEHLEEAFEAVTQSAGVNVLGIEPLVFMKLVAHRRQDLLDVVELLKAGADSRRIAAYLAAHAPELSGQFEQLVEEAD